MFDAIKNLWKRKDDAPPGADLPSHLADLLRTDLGRLDRAGAGLGRSAFRYVTSGDEGDVLLRIPGSSSPGTALLLKSTSVRFGQSAGASSERRAFFAQHGKAGGAVLHRLGEVYAAAAWGKGTAAGPLTPFRLWPHLPERLLWMEALVREALELDHPAYLAQQKHQPSIAVEAVEAALAAAAEPTDWLVRAVVFHEADYSYSYFGQEYLPRLTGLSAAFARHSATVCEGLQHAQAAHRAHVAGLLARLAVPLDERLRARLESLWVGGAKTVREAVERLLVADAESLARSLPALEKVAVEGDSAERLQAVLAYGRVAPQRAADFLRGRLEAEKSSRIRSEIERILGVAPAAGQEASAAGPGDPGEAGAGAYADALVVPTAKTYDPKVELPADFEARLVARFDEFNQRANAAHEQWWDRTEPKWRRGKRGLEPQVGHRQARAVVAVLTGVDRRAAPAVDLPRLHHGDMLGQELTELVEECRLPLVAVLRLGFALGLADRGTADRVYHLPAHPTLQDWLRSYVARQDPELSLLDLQSACDAAGVPTDWIEKLYLGYFWGSTPNPLGLATDGIWPFFATRTEGLAAALGIRESARFKVERWHEADLRRRAYAVLRSFPRPPQAFAGYLWEQALGTSKLERPLAQACLAGYPNREQPIIRALEDGRKDVRSAAADWLAELRVAEAVGPLKKALAGEKHDEPKAAMMGALEALGVDVDQFLNRKKLLAEAERGLAKPLPADLAWFPFDGLPSVHWEKNRQAVPPAILRWLVVQAFRVKSPEPNPLLRRYCALMRPDERQALGRYVLDAWLHQDTLPKHDHAEASRLADQQARQLKQYAVQWPQYYKDFDEETARKRALEHFLNECLGSANSSKGILAVAGACCGGDAVPPVQRYLKLWYGQRVHQCKALIQMLSWVEHPLAVQLILAVATRFRTKSIQQEAARYVDEIAQRRGWTRDELADRTVPTAGFESDGTQTIDYGTRQFTARLAEDFSVQLSNAAGKPIQSLPDATQAEDEAEVKALKKQWSANKKELAQVLALQRERLYEAMCVEREWRYEDWELYLNQHPIVGRYCQRLVWVAQRGDQRFTFRPLPDRTLTDVGDEPVELRPDDRVRLAHQSLLTEEEAAAWLRHLDDYAVEPLFRQLGGSFYVPDEPALQSTGIGDFEGHLIGTFKLRGRAGKLGYTRGSAEDGGWFHTYLKSFPSLRLQAVIEFTGSSLPEENRTAALLQAYFVRQREDERQDWSWSHRPLKLREIPRILLAETHGDLRLIAAEGSGFDPEWQKKTQW